MIKVTDHGNGKKCIIELEGPANVIAQQYALLTMDIIRQYPDIITAATEMMQQEVDNYER